jgi:hypothetical protein
MAVVVAVERRVELGFEQRIVGLGIEQQRVELGGNLER